MDGFIGTSSLRWVVGSEKEGKTDAFNFNDVPIFNFNNNTATADAQAPRTSPVRALTQVYTSSIV
jgi:hypothetical protein